MGTKKGSRRKAPKEAAGKRSDPAREALIRDDGGLDWGWPAVHMVMANPELSRRLVNGGFVGCGYGIIPPEGPPFISLVGENLAGMQSALALLKEWTTLSGPSAIRIEIAYQGAGYSFTISQQHDLLRWRLAGVDSVSHPLMMVMSHTKRMDSRHPNLDRLASYSRRPLAPVWLIVNEISKGALRSPGSRELGFVPDWKNAILLPRIDVYRTAEERPANSLARLEAEARLGEWPPRREQDPDSVASTRERRLAASFPKTLHVVRHTGRAKHLLEHGLTLGCAPWQVEQAICNLRSAELLAYQPSSKVKRLSMIDTIRDQVLEPASAPVSLDEISADQISHQVALDTAYLLRRLEPDVPLAPVVGDRIRRVGELGYG